MDYKVILRQGAIDDLAEIVAYISRDDPQAAQRVGNRLVAAAESLAAMPYRGKAMRGRPGDAATGASLLPDLLRSR